MGRRRNRDRHAHSSASPEAVASSAGPSSWLPGNFTVDVDEPTRIERERLEQLIRGGHYRLRFAPEVEDAFQTAEAPARRRLLGVCGVVGLLGYWLGSAHDAQLMPDAAALASAMRVVITVFMVISVAAMWRPPRRARHDFPEWLTAINTMLIAGAMLVLARHSRSLTTLTHSAVLLHLIMYVGLAARLRFRFTLWCSALTFLAYGLLVHGHDPVQAMVVAQNIKLFAVGMSFTLVANYLFEHRDRRAYLLRRLGQVEESALRRVKDKLQQLTLRDPLTGISNRRQFQADLDTACSQAQFSRRPVAMLMVDVDYFKNYNDTYGHPMGDVCLRRVADVVGSVAGRQGGDVTVARIGGEEFAMVLPGASAADARAVGQEVCAAVSRLGLAHAASSVADHVTVSVGVGLIEPGQPRPARTLVAEADAALYEAKSQGRDRCVCAPAARDAGLATELPEGSDTRTSDLDSRGSAQVKRFPAPQGSAEPFERALRERLNLVRFPKAMEAEYLAQELMGDGRKIFWLAMLGGTILSVYILSSIAMFGDIAAEMTRTVWMLIALVAAVAIMALAPIGALSRARGFLVGISAIAVLTVWSVSHSRMDTSLSFAAAAVLIPMFGAVAARQSFWHASVSIGLTVFAVLGWLHAHGDAGHLILDDTRFMVINAALYSLIVAYTLDRGGRLEWLLAQIGRVQRDHLRAATERLAHLSMIDPLTQLYNRRQFEADFSRVWQQAAKRREEVAMLIVDVDHFKAYNDGYGHPQGDRCLQQVASHVAKAAKRSGGMAVRLGGEEFAILLPDCSEVQALEVALALCADVRRTGLEHRYSPDAPRVSVSIGVAAMAVCQTQPPVNLLAAADDALYRAKSEGRDRVAGAGPGASGSALRKASPAAADGGGA